MFVGEPQEYTPVNVVVQRLNADRRLKSQPPRPDFSQNSSRRIPLGNDLPFYVRRKRMIIPDFKLRALGRGLVIIVLLCNVRAVSGYRLPFRG